MIVFPASVHHLLGELLVQTTPQAENALRLIAATVLVMIVCGLIYVLRHVRSLKAEAGSGDNSGRRRADYIMIFVASVVIFAIACFLLFRMATA